jgi:hypothetical protein
MFKTFQATFAVTGAFALALLAPRVQAQNLTDRGRDGQTSGLRQSTIAPASWILERSRSRKARKIREKHSAGNSAR